MSPSSAAKRETRSKQRKEKSGSTSSSAAAAAASDSESGSVSDFQESDDDRCSTPESQKDTKCSVCARIVNSSDKSLQCDQCNQWCHIKCGGVTKEHYKQMVQLDESNIEIQWHCPPCVKLAGPANGTHMPNTANCDLVKQLQRQQNIVGGVAASSGPSSRNNGTTMKEAATLPATKSIATSGVQKVQGVRMGRQGQPTPVKCVVLPKPPPPTRVVVGPTGVTKTTPTTTRIIVGGGVTRTPPVTTRVVICGAGNTRTTPSNTTTPTRVIVGTSGTTKTTPTTIRVPVTHNGRSNTGRLSFPDCKIRELPFFPVKSTLLRPCNLTPKDSSQEAQQQNLAFYLTQEQANTVNNGRKVEANGMVVYKMHILLRFTKMAPDNVHDDDFPKNLCLKVNNKVCPLPNPKPVPANRPNMEAKRPPKPLIVTSLCKLNTKSCLNQISITWTPSDTTYTVSIYLVEKLTPVDLLGSLKNRGMRDPEITKALIRSKLEDKEQDEIATTSCKVTMACPLGMARMNYPARASTCDHLQCFDADTYLRMNEKKPKWVCPVCNKPAYFENLFLDGFYIQLLQSTQFRALSTNDIVLNQDASWEPVISEGVGVSDDSEEEDPLSVATPVANLSGLNKAGSADPDIIPITPQVDADGAPILSQLAQLPIAPAAGLPPTATSVDSGLAGKTAGDSDFFRDGELPPEDDFVDWNFSVKFFQFVRTPPTCTDPSRQLTAGARASASHLLDSTNDDHLAGSPSQALDASSGKQRPTAVAGRARGGGRMARGRPRGGSSGSNGGRSKRAYDSDDLEYSSDEPKRQRARRGGGRGGSGSSRGRSIAGGQSGGSSATVAGAAKKTRTRYIESSADESSENEADVLTRPVVPSTNRPSRNCRRSTNYADIEKAGDVLDYLLN